MAVTEKEALPVIVGMALVTYLPRAVPLMVFSGRRLPAWLGRWLGFVPVAIMGALLCASLDAQPGAMSWLGLDAHALLPAVAALVVAVRYRSIARTVAVGVLSAMVMRLLVR